MNIVYYAGQRIYFRPIEPEDEPQLRRWINDPRVWATLNHRGPMNSVREREWIENLGKSPHDYVFGIVARDGDRLIGTAGLHRVNPVSRNATFGIAIGDVDAQNHGFGSEATQLMLRFGFRELNLHRIELHVLETNPRAIRVYEKAGYVFEGRRRQAVFRDGRFVDVLLYAVLRDEWTDPVTSESTPEPTVVPA